MLAATYTPSSTGAGKVTQLKDWNADGVARDFSVMFSNIVSILMNSIVSICAAVFITGAFLYIIGSFGKEDLKSNGKNMMIGSLIGLAIVQLGRVIVHVTLLFMYWGF
jgi:uncharacterized membrane protein